MPDVIHTGSFLDRESKKRLYKYLSAAYLVGCSYAILLVLPLVARSSHDMLEDARLVVY